MLTAAIHASLIEMAIFAGVVVLAAGIQRRNVSWSWLPLLIAVFALHELAQTRFFWRLPEPDIFADLKWNWFNKILATVITLILILVIPRMGLRRAGVTLRQEPGSLPAALGFTVILLGLYTAAAVYFGWREESSLEDVLFQATMPGIEEEIFYRGLLLVLLNEMFGRPLNVLGARMGWGAMITAIIFGLVHGVGWTADGVSFSSFAMARTFISGLIFVWLRERSGSVLLPVFVHNYGNIITYVL